MHVCHIHNNTSTEYAYEEHLFQPNHPFTPWPQAQGFHSQLYTESTMESFQSYLHPLVFGVEGLIVSFPDLPEPGEQTGMEVYTAESSVAN